MDEMKIAIVAFFSEHTPDPTAIGRRLESLGFDAVVVGDHPALPVKVRAAAMDDRLESRATWKEGQPPDYYAHMPDPFLCLMAAASATSRLKLATGVCLVTEREPIATAKAIATLDLYSKGRVIFGVGTGGVPEESAMMGIPFNKRWEIARERIRAMKEIWTNDVFSFHGEYLNIPEARCYPKPVQKPHPPVHIDAGYKKTIERALRDTVELGDGWGPAGLDPEEMARGTQRLKQLCREAGRDFDKIEISTFLPKEYPEPRQTLDEYRAAGVHRLIFTLWPPILKERSIEDLARKYLN
jgi:probable F420-dependent oxidoreductase